MNGIDLEHAIERELAIVTENGTTIRFRLLSLDNELAIFWSFHVRILEIPSGSGYVVGRVAELTVAECEGMELEDFTSAANILLFSSINIAPGHFCLLTQGKLDKVFKIATVELR